MSKAGRVVGSFSGLFTTLSVLLFLGGFYLIDSSFLLNMVNRPWYLRLLMLLVTISASVICLRFTRHWANLISLAKGARIEYYKVIFPSKDEWLKSTFMVLTIVALFAIFLSVIDLLLAWIVNWIL